MILKQERSLVSWFREEQEISGWISVESEVLGHRGEERAVGKS